MYYISSIHLIKLRWCTKFLRIVKNTLLLVYFMSLSMLNVAYIHISQKKYEIKAKKLKSSIKGRIEKNLDVWTLLVIYHRKGSCLYDFEMHRQRRKINKNYRAQSITIMIGSEVDEVFDCCSSAFLAFLLPPWLKKISKCCVFSDFFLFTIVYCQ